MSCPVSTVHYAALTDTGRVRAHNEDALLCSPELGLWAVADGMGGHQRGEVASALAVEVLRREVACGQGLGEAVAAAHQAILAAAETDAASRGMGTTLVAVRLAGARFELAWVGDSRAYRVSAQQLELLSHDHSWVQAMVDAGELTAEQAREHPRRNVITQCLGRDSEGFEPGFREGELLPGEVLLLCSDGLHGELTDAQLLAACAEAETLQTLVLELIEAAKRHGGKDNISCIVLAPEQAVPVAPEAPRRGLLAQLLSLRKRA